MKAQLEMQLEAAKHEYRREIELIRAQATLGFKTDDQDFREKLSLQGGLSNCGETSGYADASLSLNLPR